MMDFFSCKGSEGTKKLPDGVTIHTTMGDITIKLFPKELSVFYLTSLYNYCTDYSDSRSLVGRGLRPF